jgi:hypothetical protein
MPKHYEADFKFGTANQKKVYPILKTHFGEDLKETTEQYAKYDFYNDNAYFELKTRKVSKSCYPTTLLTCNKIQDCNKEQYFIFSFTDELCFIKYDKELFSTFQRNKYSRENKEEDMVDYLFIPIGELKSIQRIKPDAYKSIHSSSLSRDFPSVII